MKKRKKHFLPQIREHTFLEAILSFLLFSVVIIAVSIYFVNSKKLIGPVFLGLGILNILILKFFKIEISSVYPDMIFGIIDNGVLVFAAVLGGTYAGVAGAIIGGAAGNALTDGIGGLFEGYVAQHQKKFEIDNERTPLSTMLGKVAGCLFGAGIGLILVWFAGTLSGLIIG
ncbi:MAG: hypothetical protein OQK82_05935 [Candidatus Pacearchaeota archaeon]|nr:hypothetical protein [Candidatus Pacearchaeota archaeon]